MPSESAIFMLGEDGTLVEMLEQPYASEEVLQKLLEDFPRLLGGDLMGHDSPRNFVMVSREISLVGEERGVGRIDHVFLDQEGVPTLVEVKRIEDNRIRREVVGQMLDYAANAVAYWPVDDIRARFETTSAERGIDAEERLSPVMGDEGVDAYWARVGANLTSGRLRLIFVADEIPAELKRIIEFLNEQMRPAEVLGVEVKHYTDAAKRVRNLVPRVVGLTAASETRKGSREKRHWDETSFLHELEAKRGAADARVARELIEWARVELPRLGWGTGALVGSFIPELEHAGRNYSHWPISVRTDGGVTIEFKGLSRRPPFDDVGLRREFVRRLNETAGVSIPEDGITGRPQFRIAVLAASPEALDSFKAALDWFCETVRSHAEDHAGALVRTDQLRGESGKLHGHVA